MKASVFAAASVDGFIARPDGAIDWLPPFEEGGEDYGYREFMASVDALVMGRNTYDLALSFAAWPYGETPVFVLSSRPLPPPGGGAARVERLCAPPREIYRLLEERGFRHLYVDGGKTVQAFLAEGLVDELIVTRVPVLLGEGIPLFGPGPGDIRLEHVSTRAFPDGLVQSRYRTAGRRGNRTAPRERRG